MTELEKIKYAKQAVEKLANGINPFTGQGVPDDDTLNQVKVSRCLFYVADILRQVEENGGVAKKGKKSAKQPFSLSPDSLRIFNFPPRLSPSRNFWKGSTASLIRTT